MSKVSKQSRYGFGSCAGCGLGIVVLAVLSIAAYPMRAEEGESPQKRHARTELHMGVEFQVAVYAADAEAADAALTAAMSRVAALDQTLSDYNSESELSRLSATSQFAADQTPPAEFQAVKVSDDLWRVLVNSQEISAASGGAFDITVGPLTKLWRRARRQKELPEKDLFEKARAAVGWQFLKLDNRTKTARLLKPNMRLDLGGIAKGYAADEALAAIHQKGLTRALVRASGDIAAGDPPPGESGWLVGIAPLDPDAQPERFVRLANRAISTSGDSRQHLIVNGRRYSHIIDPQTGLGIAGRSSVSVIAPRGITADGLASAVSVLGPDRGLKLAEGFKDCELLMVYEDGGGKQQVVESAGFKQFDSALPASESASP